MKLAWASNITSIDRVDSKGFSLWLCKFYFQSIISSRSTWCNNGFNSTKGSSFKFKPVLVELDWPIMLKFWFCFIGTWLGLMCCCFPCFLYCLFPMTRKKFIGFLLATIFIYSATCWHGSGKLLLCLVLCLVHNLKLLIGWYSSDHWLYEL